MGHAEKRKEEQKRMNNLVSFTHESQLTHTYIQYAYTNSNQFLSECISLSPAPIRSYIVCLCRRINAR